MSSSDRIALFVGWPPLDADEAAFWHRLRDALQRRGLRLVLSTVPASPPDLGILHVPSPVIDAFFPANHAEASISLDALGLDVDALLAREEAYGAPAVLPAIESYRRRAAIAMAWHWRHTLTALDPAVVIVWNGQHTSQMIPAAVSRAAGIPLLYLERAPISQAFFADERGISAASAVAARASWVVADARWQARADAVIRRIAAGAHTWWEQPASRHADRQALRRQLGIPADARVLLFAGQLDEDTQQFLFSPHFESNLSAFVWFLDQLRGRDDVFVLGKHHPKARVPSEVYQRALTASGVPGTWRTDLSIDDAFAVADRAAAVNSTVLYEALARGLPVLSLGGWLLSGRGAAYELRDREHGREVVEAWCVAADHEARQRSWREALAFLLSHCLYTYAPDAEHADMLGARDLAERIRQCVESAPPRPAPSIDQRVAAYTHAVPAWGWPGSDVTGDPERWQRRHWLRTQLIESYAAARRGRRLVIWGAGAAGRLAAGYIARLGGTIAAFASSSPDRQEVDGMPIISASALAQDPRDFVLVASVAAQEIVPGLVARGFQERQDFHVLDCNILVEQGPAPTPVVPTETGVPVPAHTR